MPSSLKNSGVKQCAVPTTCETERRCLCQPTARLHWSFLPVHHLPSTIYEYLVVRPGCSSLKQNARANSEQGQYKERSSATRTIRLTVSWWMTKLSPAGMSPLLKTSFQSATNHQIRSPKLSQICWPSHRNSPWNLKGLTREVKTTICPPGEQISQALLVYCSHLENLSGQASKILQQPHLQPAKDQLHLILDTSP